MENDQADVIMRDAILEQTEGVGQEIASRMCVAAALFSLAHNVGRIATVLESLAPLIQMGTAAAKEDAAERARP